MEKVISNDITKYLIVLGAGSIGLWMLLTNVISRIRGAFKPYQKATLWYTLAALFFSALVALAAYPGIIERPLNAFLFFQVYFLLMGCWHTYLMPKKLRWSGDDKAFVSELVFTLLLAV